MWQYVLQHHSLPYNPGEFLCCWTTQGSTAMQRRVWDPGQQSEMQHLSYSGHFRITELISQYLGSTRSNMHSSSSSLEDQVIQSKSTAERKMETSNLWAKCSIFEWHSWDWGKVEIFINSIITILNYLKGEC